MGHKFKRIFTNNYKYGEDTIPYMDSLAYTVLEFLYTKGMAKGERLDCLMENHIRIYNFMTVAHYFIETLKSDFAKITIKEFINNMRKRDYPYGPNLESIIITNDGWIHIKSVSNAVVVSLLWTTWIYARVAHKITHTKKLDSAQKLLYTMIKDFLSQINIPEDHPLLVHADDAVETMIQHMIDKKEELMAEPTEEGNKKLEEELEAVKEAYETLMAENKSLKEQQQKEDASVEEIEWHDKVRLNVLLRLMKDDGANLEKHGNKRIAAEIMQAITGLPLTTCKNYCSNQDLSHTHHEEEILKLNSKIQALEMKIRL